MVTITLRTGDIFTTECEVITNPTNSIGVMGSGLAFAFKTKQPQVCEEYSKWCASIQDRRDEIVLLPPNLYSWVGPRPISGPSKILMFPTKKHWKNKSQLDYIKQNMPLAVEILNINNCRSVAFPKLGCGLGGLDWRQVKPIIFVAIQKFNGHVEIWE